MTVSSRVDREITVQFIHFPGLYKIKGRGATPGTQQVLNKIFSQQAVNREASEVTLLAEPRACNFRSLDLDIRKQKVNL